MVHSRVCDRQTPHSVVAEVVGWRSTDSILDQANADLPRERKVKEPQHRGPCNGVTNAGGQGIDRCQPSPPVRTMKSLLVRL